MIYTVTLNPAVDRELLVPEIEFDSVLRASESRVDYGGKGFNFSRMLMSLGVSSAAIGFAGGRSGELLRDGLHSVGIQTDFVWIEGETRTNVNIVSQAQNQYWGIACGAATASLSGTTVGSRELVEVLARRVTVAPA